MGFLSCSPDDFMCNDDKTISTTTDGTSSVGNEVDADHSIITNSTNNNSILNRSMDSTSAGMANGTTTTGTTAPTLVESSYSDTSSSATLVDRDNSNSSDAVRKNAAGKPGETSPSSLVFNRKLSAGIATDPSNKHPVLEGRPIIVPESLDGASISCSSQQTMAAARTESKIDNVNGTAVMESESPIVTRRSVVMPKAPMSGPARPSTVTDRSVSAVASLGIVTPSPPFTQSTASEKGTEGTKTKTDVAEQRRSSKKESNGSRPQLHRSSSEHVKYDVSQDFILHPSPLRLDAWSEPAGETFNVRSKGYLNDKVKKPSQPSAFHLLAVDLVQVPKGSKPFYKGLCSHPHERVQQALKRERETGKTELPPFVFAINLVVPGQVVYHTVFYFGCDASTLNEIRLATTPFGKLMHRFVYSPTDSAPDNAFRNNTFKLIPRIVDGNFIVRKAVGSKPAVLGKKIIQKYVRDQSPDARFFEVMVDIASDAVAQRIVKLALGYTKTLTVDMAFCLEGNHPATLPERVFGVVRMKNIDFKMKDGKRVLTPI